MPKSSTSASVATDLHAVVVGYDGVPTCRSGPRDEIYAFLRDAAADAAYVFVFRGERLPVTTKPFGVRDPDAGLVTLAPSAPAPGDAADGCLDPDSLGPPPVPPDAPHAPASQAGAFDPFDDDL